MSLIGDRLRTSGSIVRNVWGEQKWKEPLKVLEDNINARDDEVTQKRYTFEQACKA
jgi:hypothetical protein